MLSEAAIPRPFRSFRRFPVDGGMLLFDRASGTNVLLDGEETSHLRQHAPRAVQFGITNVCNLACSFCSRELDAPSTWTPDEAFEWLAALARAGVLEVAFGGGEPLAFPEFDDLVQRLHLETPLAVHFTTNGLLLDEVRLDGLIPNCGEIRLSLYDDNAWRSTLTRLVAHGARFGVNWLMTPTTLPQLEARVLDLVARGCRDVLLLSYNGPDDALHLDAEHLVSMAQRVRTLSHALRGRCTLKLDVCWGDRVAGVPRLFEQSDCRAGRDFVVITSDRRVQPCSFHDVSIPVSGPDDVLRVWRESQSELRCVSSIRGCTRFGPDAAPVFDRENYR